MYEPKSILRTLAPLVAFSLIPAGCGGNGPAGYYVPPADPDRLTFYEETDPPTLDPAYSWGVFDGMLVGLIFSNLVRFDREANLIPDAAERWEVADGGMEYTFRLDPAARFTTGAPVTADDVKFSFERVLDPQTASNSRWVLENIATIEAMDERTVKIRLKEPFAPFLNLLAMPAAAIVPRETVERMERGGIPFGENPVGSGPWRFVDWQHDQYVDLERVEDHWGEKPVSPKLRFRIMGNPFTAMAEFETGNLAVIDPLPEPEILRLKTHPDWQNHLELAPMLTLDMIVFNTERPPFGGEAVRRALCQTIDVPLLLDAVREGAGIPANGPVPKGLRGSSMDRGPYPNRPDEVLPILREAGLEGRELVFLLPSADNFIRSLGEVLQAEWKRLGIRVKLLQPEWVTYKRMILDGDFDLGFQNWYADYPDGDNFLYPLFHSSQIGSVNTSRLRDPEVDAVIEASQRELDPDRRTALLERANEMLFERAPAVFLWYRSKYVLKQPWIEGYSEPLIFNGTRFLTERIAAVQ